MRYSWSYLKNPEDSDFPETYILRTTRGDRLKVEANRLRGMIRIIAEEYSGRRWQSVISNGVVIREIDALTGQAADLEKVLSRHSVDLSSLPDNQILRLIGGNYGVMTEFLGRAERIFELDPYFSEQNIWQWLAGLWHRVSSLPGKWLRSLLPLLIYRPKIVDLIDAVLLGSLSWLLFQWNYSFLHSGAVACLGSLICGLTDIFLRQRSPYLIKVIGLFLPGLVALYLGWYYQ